MTPSELRACASALRALHEREPTRRTLHLAEACEREAARVERLRRELEEWPGPGSETNRTHSNANE